MLARCGHERRRVEGSNMGRNTASTNGLVRLLADASVPVYVVDDGRYIRYANPALFEWIESKPEHLIGRRCDYHSHGPRGDMAVGLCPPPEALAGKRVRSVVAWTRPNGEPARRWGDFMPLADEVVGDSSVIVLLDVTDVHEDASVCTADQEPNHRELHEFVRSFQKLARRRFGIQQLIGESPAIRRVRAQVELAIQCPANVLIVGPPGSGREQIARSIHYGEHHDTAARLVPIECELVDAEILDTTLAALSRSSLEEGHEGETTLLLLEADRLSNDSQSILLEKAEHIVFPLRLISTARQGLIEGQRPSSFHKDLAHVLSTLVIELPALAHRIEDLPALAQLFLEEMNAEGQRQHGGFTPDALDHLAAYSWPGNADELFAAVREMHRQSEGPLVGIGDLPKRIRLAADAAAHPPRDDERIVLDEFLADIERELFQRALRRARGNKAQAARLLGLTRARLHRRLNQLGLGPTQE